MSSWDAGIHWSDLFEPALGLLLLTGLISLLLWVITVISLLIMMLPGKNTFPQPVETPPMGVVEPSHDRGSFGKLKFE